MVCAGDLHTFWGAEPFLIPKPKDGSVEPSVELSVEPFVGDCLAERFRH